MVLSADTRTNARFRTLTSLAEMDQVARQWKALEQRCGDRLSYFQTFGWCRSWIAAFAGEERGIAPSIETVWRGDRLVAVWPLMLATTGGVRILQTLGEPHSQYCNLIWDQASLTRKDAERLLARIQEDRCCDVAVFQAVPETSPLSQVLHGRNLESSSNASALLDLSAFASAQEYDGQLGRLQKRNRNRRRNRLKRLGELNFTVVWPTDSRFAPLVRECASMKRRWLAETGRYSVGFSMDGFDSFLAGLTGDASTTSGACLSVLKTGDRIAAMELGFVKDRHYYSYLGAFDWDLRDLSPGKVQMDFTVRWLIEQGIMAYDLLGNPADYKISWSNRLVTLHAYAMPFSLKGRLYVRAWLGILRPAAKRVYQSLPNAVRRLAGHAHGLGPLLLWT